MALETTMGLTVHYQTLFMLIAIDTGLKVNIVNPVLQNKKLGDEC